MIEWIFKNLGVVIFAVIVISQLVRGAARARKAAGESVPAAPENYDEQRRTREIQERVRRQIAERRGAPATPAPVRELAPSAPPTAETTQLPELFGGPLGRMLEELQKRAQPQAVPIEPPPLVATRSDNTELERQAKLAKELQRLEEARTDMRRRTEHRTEEKRLTAESEPGLRGAARGQLLDDLAHPQSLRRAMVLREVLGPPVALR
ncbi:MAG: hypothetical protein ABIQ12_08200 [Opitutaceae bacterium]